VHWAQTAIVFVLALASGCRRPSSGAGSTSSTTPVVTAPDLAASSAPATADALRDDSRLVLEHHCGQCHIRDYPTALPRALAVFDLREPDWSARMSDAQLKSAAWRLGEPLPPDGKSNEVSADERARFQRYVDAELVRRVRFDGGSAR